MILKEQSPQSLLAVRGRLYELLTHCIPESIIIRSLTEQLIRDLDDLTKVQVARLAADYEHRMQKGSKPIFHLEAFVAKFMSQYRRFMIELMG